MQEFISYCLKWIIILTASFTLGGYMIRKIDEYLHPIVRKGKKRK